MKFLWQSSNLTRPKKGRIEEWNPDHRFGFICRGSERWFLAARSFSAHDVNPSKGDRVRFIPGLDSQGRPCATQSVLIPGTFRRVVESWLSLVLLLLTPALAILQFPRFVCSVAATLTCLSMLTYSFYRRDKKAALSGGARIPESTLRNLEVAGGWPGALVARRRLHHEETESTHQSSFWTLIIWHQILAFELLLVTSGTWQSALASIGSATVSLGIA